MNTNETNSNRMEQIISILKRERSEKLIDTKDIQSRLIDITNSVGIPTEINGMSADEIEFAEAFNEAAPEWPKNAVATERAEHYEKISGTRLSLSSVGLSRRSS